MKSMTGYANRMFRIGNHSLNFELKSLNGRFLTTNISLPESLTSLEKDIIAQVNVLIKRGAFQLKLNLLKQEETQKITYDYDAISDNLNTIQNFVGLASLQQLSLKDVLGIFNPFTKQSIELFTEEDQGAILEAFKELLQELNTYRQYEGDRLKKDLETRNKKIKAITEKLASEIKKSEEKIKQTLQDKLQSLFSDKDIEQHRLSQEIVYLINKHDFSEEVIRLESHINLFNETLEIEDSIGRKLDFILQEMNREANTIASKSKFNTVTTLVIELRTEIEKMKEQVQNVE